MTNDNREIREMIYENDHREYSIGEIEDGIVEIIWWNSETRIWTETVQWSGPATVGDAIEQAKTQHKSTGGFDD